MCLAAIPGAVALAPLLGVTESMAGLVIAGSAVAAGSSALQFMGQSQAASSQQQMWNQTAELTRKDLNLKYQQMQMREIQEREAFGQQASTIMARTAKAVGYTQAAAGEGGVYGNTIATLLQDFNRQQSDSLMALQRNAMYRSQQFGLESLAYQQQGISSINRSAPTQSQPSIFAPIFQTIGAGLGYVGMGLASGAPSGGGSAPPYYLAAP